MALNITYFDKVKYSSIDFNDRFSDFFGNGILKTTDFPVTYPSTANMTINIGVGTAFVNGYRIYNDSVTTLTVNSADTTNPRIDIVQIGYSATTDGSGLTTGNAVLEIKQGTAAASPIEPGADPNYIKLYAISVPANVTSITSSNVTDKRGLVPLNIDGSQIAFNGAQKTIYQGPTAPLNPSDKDLWIDTSVTPNVLKRYNASSSTWVSVNAEDWVKSFGIGGDSATISNTDLNNLKNNGLYFGQNLTNAPFGNTGWFFIIQQQTNNGSNIIQKATYTDNTSYVRYYNGTTWTAWEEINSSMHTNTIDLTNSSGHLKLIRRNADGTIAGQTLLGVDVNGYLSMFPNADTSKTAYEIPTFNDFTVSKSQTGYQKLPNGLIIQWAKVPSVPNGVLTNYNLPITFPTAFLQAVPGIINASGPCGWNPTSTSQIGLIQTQGSARDMSYIAIGY